MWFGRAGEHADLEIGEPSCKSSLPFPVGLFAPPQKSRQAFSKAAQLDEHQDPLSNTSSEECYPGGGHICLW